MDPLDIQFAERLLKITDGCRPDMHEPDEQGITAIATGWQLDNAFSSSNPRNNCGEMAVGIAKNTNLFENDPEWFNLATLIALARIGARTQLVSAGIIKL